MSSPLEPPETALAERLSDLEARVDAMRAELRRLRADLGMIQPAASAPSVGPAAAPSPMPAAPTRPPLRPPKSIDFESLVGRYGTIGVATLAILLGVGAFLQWAIARGLLGPQTRVVLGALAALGVAAIGLRLRRRGTVRFGNILLAIALAIAHLDAWAAGPLLGVVPSAVALAVAALARAALATLAIQDGEEALFALGMGGALLAPFVTSSDSGRIVLLLLFGWVVLTGAIVALREPRWELARFVLLGGAATYVAAAGAAFARSRTVSTERYPMLFALGVAFSAILLAEPTGRRRIAGRLLALAAFTLLGTAQLLNDRGTALAFGVIGTLAVHALRRRSEGVPGDRDTVMHAFVLPLAFQLAALLAFGAATPTMTLLVALPWVALSVAFGVRAPIAQRGWHFAVAFTGAAVALLMAAQGHREIQSIGSSALALAVLLVGPYAPGRILLVPLGLALIAGTTSAYDLLDARPRFGYVPFITLPSLIALAAVASWQGVSRRIGPFLEPASSALVPSHGLVRSLGLIAALGWGQRELARAFSSDLATFNLIAYYAVTGVALIGVGRSRGVTGLRQAGLAIAILAALKAVLQAQTLDAIGLRVGSYLLVGAFLLGVGYWYRARDGAVT